MVGDVGCAIVGQTGRIAPADKRLYAIRDVTATVDSIPLITGSILSKKLAAGLQSLVMDVKTGNGAFMQSMEDAEVLARSIVDVANGAGVRTTALITDMNEPLADCAGNAVEVAHAMEFLEGRKAGTRIHEATLAFAAQMLVDAGIETEFIAAERRASDALDSGAALEVFGRMVAAMGGPADFAENWKAHLPLAPVILPIEAPRAGFVSSFESRDIGLAVIGLGGGRIRPEDGVDHRTGFTGIVPKGRRIEAGEPLAFVHAVDEDAAGRAARDYLACVGISEEPVAAGPVILKRIS